MFTRESPTVGKRIYTQKEFLEQEGSNISSGVGLWSDFCPHLATFKERWECLVTRDLDYESLLHKKGNKDAIVPWVGRQRFSF